MIQWFKSLLADTVPAGGLAACGGDGNDHVPVAPAPVTIAIRRQPRQPHRVHPVARRRNDIRASNGVIDVVGKVLIPALRAIRFFPARRPAVRAGFSPSLPFHPFQRTSP